MWRALLLLAAISWFATASAQEIGPAPGGSGSAALVTVSKTANYSVQSAESGTYFDNGGAGAEVDFSLPTPSAGLHFCFTNVSSLVMKVVAVGTTLQIGTTVSSNGGFAQASSAGSFVCVAALSGAPSKWIASSATGTWTVQ